MPTIYFLEASMPLVKTINAKGSTPYPHVANFKSHKTTPPTLKEFYSELITHAAKGHCLIKGKLHRVLDFTSRAGSTHSNDTTDWICLDLDGAPFKDPEEFMSGHPLLQDVSYIVQYSASQGLGKPGLRCHIFIFLNQQYNVTYLKSWLMSLNLDGSLWDNKLRTSRELNLSPSKAALHWPIDITVCQNDKLIYIAPATVAPGVPYKQPNPAIQLVPKKNIVLDTKLLGTQTIERWKVEQRALINLLRKEQGLHVVRPTKMVKEYEVQGNPGEATLTETWTDLEAGFQRFNLNGGDSNAYYHPLDNYELIHNFKGEPSYHTKELLPQYYKDCKARDRHEATQPTEQGEVILGVCDKRSAALWKVSWNKVTRILQLYPARSDKQLADWAMQHNKAPNEFTPQWNFEFNPQNNTVLDLDKQYLNTYVPSRFYTKFQKPAKPTSIDLCPTIKKVIMSCVSNNEWTPLTEHFMNWLAVIFQFKCKTGSAWLFNGIPGTGKNLLSNHILRPLIGNKYVKETLITGLEDQFNGWLEHCLLCFINEIQVSSSEHRKIISSKLRNWITDSPLDIRPMGVTRYDADNFCNFIANSNKHDAVEIDNSDRRYNIGDWQDKKLPMTDKEAQILIPQELEHFFNYLMTRPADKEQAREIFENEARRSVIAAGQDSYDMLASALLDGDMGPFVEAMPDIQTVLDAHGADSARAVAYHTIIMRELQALVSTRSKHGMKSVLSRLSRDELFILFDHCVGCKSSSPNKFTRMLLHKGIKTKKLRKPNGDLCYGMEVTWTASEVWCDEHTIAAQPLRRVK